MQVKWEEDWFIQRYMGSCVCRPRSSAQTLFKEETNEIYTLLLPQTRKDYTLFKGKLKLRI